MSRVPRIYIPEALSPGQDCSVTGSAHHHLAHVLRLRAGAAVVLFCGDGLEHTGQVTELGRHATGVKLNGHHAGPPPSPLQITLALGISKPRHFDLALQKATELGISGILPLSAKRSPRHDSAASGKQMEHWRSILINACEQCGRSELPELTAPLSPDALSGQVAGTDAVKLLLHPLGTPLSHEQPASSEVVFAVGPEGGFTDTECSALETAGFRATSCGPRILRTETAPLAMLAVVQFLWGDLG